MKSTRTLLISLASMIGLVACSGSSNHSSPASSTTPTNAEPTQAVKNPQENAKSVSSDTNTAQPNVAPTQAVKNPQENAKSVSSDTNTAQPNVTPTQAVKNPQENAKSVSSDTNTAQPNVAPTQAVKNPQENATPASTAIKPQWRQLTQFQQSNETQASSPQITGSGVAYNNGDSSYLNNDKIGDLKNDLTHTNYDPNFLNQVNNDPNQLQTYIVTDKAGNELGRFNFINQHYSSYANWESSTKTGDEDALNKGIMTAYVADPTPADKALLTQKQIANYSGHTIFNGQTAKLTLTADFNTMTLSGKISERHDNFLDNRAKFATEKTSGLEYTTDKDEEEEGYVKYITPTEMKTRLADYSKKEITIAPAEIHIDNGLVSFKGKSGEALQYQADNGKTASFGELGGIFAGEKASEVVGEIQNSDNLMSFGATEVTQ